jgi:hypothetical protein
MHARARGAQRARVYAAVIGHGLGHREVVRVLRSPLRARAPDQKLPDPELPDPGTRTRPEAYIT